MNDDTLREKLEADFKELYVKKFTTDWVVQRKVRGLEIEVMPLDNLKAFIHQYAQAYAESIIGKPKDIQVSNSQLMEAIDNSESERRDYVVITLNRTSQHALNNEKKGKL